MTILKRNILLALSFLFLNTIGLVANTQYKETDIDPENDKENNDGSTPQEMDTNSYSVVELNPNKVTDTNENNYMDIDGNGIYFVQLNIEETNDIRYQILNNNNDNLNFEIASLIQASSNPSSSEELTYEQKIMQFTNKSLYVLSSMSQKSF